MKTFEQRFWGKVEKTDTCWNWTGAHGGEGHGQFYTHGRSGTTPAHRVSYSMHIGPIPEGMVVDHMCHNPSCVNPDHLRLATVQQNIENRRGAQKNSKTGVRGVSWASRRNRFVAVATKAGRHFYVGQFTSLAEAEAAVIAKRNEIMTHNIADRMASS